MFRNIKKKTKKDFNWKKKSNIIFLNCSSFVFALYTLISPNLKIMLNFFLYQGRSQRVEPILKI